MKLQLIWITFVCPIFFKKSKLLIENGLENVETWNWNFHSFFLFFPTFMSSAVGVSGIKEIWLKKMWKISCAWLGAAGAGAGVGECK